MENLKITKGEWKLSKKAGTDDLARIKDSNGNIIADCFWLGEDRSKEEAEANAKLMAASKDLLEALYGIQSDIGGGKKYCEHNFNCTCAWNKVKEAIKKATE